MNTTSDSNTYFYVCFGDADLKFGVPTAMAQKVAESTRKTIKKKVSLATAIANGEKAIAEAFRKGLHRNQKASKNLAPLIISCCLLSKEALENPTARGFILEISHSLIPSWSAEAGAVTSDAAPDDESKTCTHYRAMAGRDDIDAVMAQCRAAPLPRTAAEAALL
jgi:hypothetical protein